MSVKNANCNNNVFGAYLVALGKVMLVTGLTFRQVADCPPEARELLVRHMMAEGIDRQVAQEATGDSVHWAALRAVHSPR